MSENIKTDEMDLERLAHVIADQKSSHRDMAQLHHFLERRREICLHILHDLDEESKNSVIWSLDLVNRRIIELLQLKTVNK